VRDTRACPSRVTGPRIARWISCNVRKLRLVLLLVCLI
jgi:hypothetical protein